MYVILCSNNLVLWPETNKSNLSLSHVISLWTAILPWLVHQVSYHLSCIMFLLPIVGVFLNFFLSSIMTEEYCSYLLLWEPKFCNLLLKHCFIFKICSILQIHMAFFTRFSEKYSVQSLFTCCKVTKCSLNKTYCYCTRSQIQIIELCDMWFMLSCIPACVHSYRCMLLSDLLCAQVHFLLKCHFLWLCKIWFSKCN